jgi:hypothetical protein
MKQRIPPLTKKQRRNIAPNSLTAALYWQQIAQQPAEDAAPVAEGDQPAEQPRPKRTARKRTQEDTP